MNAIGYNLTFNIIAVYAAIGANFGTSRRLWLMPEY